MASLPPLVPPSIPPQETRRQLLRLVLRETLQDNGIPFGWVQAEALQAIAPTREGIHVRFLICQWQPRLLTYCFAFQREFKARLQAIDPTARTWLMGFSWQYALPRGTAYPALPPAHIWAAADELFRAAIALGGTLTGEHGIGILKSRWLADELGADQWELQRQITRVFDPLGILNPGKVFADA